MTRLASARSAPLLVMAAFGCSPAAVDYSALQSAAVARQRGVGVDVAGEDEEVRALLAKPLTPATAARIALLNNPGVRAQVEAVGIAEADFFAAGSLPNPVVGGALRFDGHGGPEIEIEALVNLSQLVLLPARRGVAAAGVAAARAEAIGAVLDLSFEARRALFQYQAARQSLDLSRTVLAALSAEAHAADVLRESGAITELEQVQRQALFEEARLGFQAAELRVAAARERVNALLGLFGAETRWEATPELPRPPTKELPLDTLERRAIERSLDLAVSRERFRHAAEQANVARVEGFLPELRAGVSAERGEEWSIGPAVELELPLLYQGQGEVASAHARMRAERHVHTDIAVRVRAAAREVALRLEASRAAVAYFERVLLPLRRRALEQSQLQYNAMQIGVFDLLQARRDQVETERAFVDALLDYWIARTDAEQLLSGRLTASPAAVGAASAPVPVNGSRSRTH
ncbi:MAG: TolC family protein [Pseudomonadota bacterium]|nr:MAG: hypothetical protein DIU78_16760 [Pseudomonadota bacterium]